MRPRIFSILLLAAGAFHSSLFHAQTPEFKSFNLGEGKKTQKVHSMVQDDRNLMYFGTDVGVYRYDGLQFQRIKIEDSIEVHSITSLAFHDGVLWAGGAKGELCKMAENKCVRFEIPEYIPGTKVSDLLSHEGKLYIATYGNGIFVLENDKVNHINVSNGLGDDYTYDLAVHGASIYIGTDAGISILNTAKGTIDVVSMDDGLPDNIITAICSISDSIIALGTYDVGPVHFNTKTFKVRTPTAAWEHGPIEDLVMTDNTIWAATRDNGIIVMDALGKSAAFRVYSEINGLLSNRLTTLMRDAEDNVWIGSQKGVSLYRGSTFEYLTARDGLIGENIFDVLVDSKGYTWLASDKGVMRFNYSGSGHGLVKSYLENEGQLNQQIVSLFEDSKGNIWMGSYGSGLYLLEPSTDQLRNIGKKDGLRNLNIMDITEDATGRIWLATLGGSVISLIGKGKSFDIQELVDYDHLKSEYIYTVFFGSKDILWIGTDGGGVAQYDCIANHFKPSLGGVLSSSTIYSITEDTDGNMWFSTSDNGLYRYGHGALERIGSDWGLRSDAVMALRSGADGEVAAIHSIGIDVLHKGATKFIHYSIEMPGFYFEPNLNAVHFANGRYIIGSEEGAVRLLCDHSGREALKPKVSITGLRVLFNERDLTSEAVFSYSENHIIFDFLAVWMKNPEAIRYKYIVEGFDRQWSFETQSRVATYSSLPPGTYRFKVVAGYGDGTWSDENDAVYEFTITRPFWMEWWFYLAVILVVGASVFIFIRYRTKRLLEAKELLEKEVEKRTEEIRDQKDIIEAKSEEILASINYAKRIQSAILPSEKLVKHHFPQSFVLYKPKDIVAGDFYWLDHVDPSAEIALLDEETLRDLPHGTESGVVLIAAADCTGHGVPGAMVSVVCHNALNRAVREYGLVCPSNILDKTLELVVQTFEQKKAQQGGSNETIKDGMDIALAAVYRSSAAEDKGAIVLEYSGAQNPLWLVSKRQEIRLLSEGNSTPITTEYSNWFLHEIKPDKQPIGKYAETKPFTLHRMVVEKGDTIYLFTDGFADQFGGSNGKKFKYKPMKELLLSLHDKGMDEQCRALDAFIENWRGSLEQVDDICVIGIRISAD